MRALSKQRQPLLRKRKRLSPYRQMNGRKKLRLHECKDMQGMPAETVETLRLLEMERA